MNETSKSVKIVGLAKCAVRASNAKNTNKMIIFKSRLHNQIHHIIGKSGTSISE